jgi:hypothetical protein
MADDPIEIDLAGGGASAPLALATGSKYKIVLKRPILRLEHLYHDDRPVQNAPFTVELANGDKIKGQLDENGRATVAVPSTPVQVQFGPDARPWERVDQTENPDFVGEIDSGQADDFVAARLQTSGGEDDADGEEDGDESEDEDASEDADESEDGDEDGDEDESEDEDASEDEDDSEDES